jgi:hypothetical protein
LGSQRRDGESFRVEALGLGSLWTPLGLPKGAICPGRWACVPSPSSSQSLVVAAEAAWPVQAAVTAALVVVFFLLGRYLWQGRRTRGTSGGSDAFVVVLGIGFLGFAVLFVVQHKPVTLIAVCAVVGLWRVYVGLRAHLSDLHRRKRRTGPASANGP